MWSTSASTCDWGAGAAIKQLLPEMSSQRDIVERFFNEAKAAASINHPGIVEIYDVGWHSDGSAYFAMKLLEGDSLAKRLRTNGPMPPVLAATITRQVASALAAAHARGIVHRDLKPDNVILVADEEVAIGERAIILDFGIAKLFGDRPIAHKTRTGSVMGTPYYMSPEQCRGAGEVDHRTDIYALGCILYELLTGRPPFVAEGAGEILGMHQFVEPAALRSVRPDVSPELEALVMRTLAKPPERRPQSMAELATALQAFSVRGTQSLEMAAQRHSAPQAAVPEPARHPAVMASASQPSTLSRRAGEVVTGASTSSGSRRGMLLAIGGAVVVIGAVVAMVIASSGGGRNDTSASLASASPDASTSSAAGGFISAAVDAAPVAVDALSEQEIADRERANATAEIRYQDFVQAAAKKDHVGALVALEKIPNESAYRQQAQTAMDALHAEYMEVTLAQAKKLARAGNCRELARLATNAAKVYADTGAAVRDVSCSTQTTVATGGESASNPGSTSGSTPATSSSKSAAELVQEANDAARSGQYIRARRAADEALRQDPGNQLALTAAAIASCNLKDSSAAKRYINKLSGQRQGMARQVCLRNNVSVD